MAAREVRSVAQNVLLSNLVMIENKAYPVAGRTLKRALFIRDACFSARAYVLLKRSDAVVNVIQLYFERMNATGDPIEAFDAVSPGMRSWYSFLRNITSTSYGPEPTLENTHFSSDVDLHLLVLLAISYLPTKQQTELFRAYNEQIRRIVAWYSVMVDKDLWLLHQPPDTDWKKSFYAPEGCYFYTNLLLFEVQRRFPKHFALIPQDKLRDSLQKFTHEKWGVFRERWDDPDRISAEGNLLALLWHVNGRDGFILKKSMRELAAAIWASPLGQGGGTNSTAEDARTDCCCCFGCLPARSPLGLPGIASYPAPCHPTWQSHITGMATEHGLTFWTWLVAIAQEVSARIELNVSPIPEHFWACMTRPGNDNKPCEVIELLAHHETLKPVQTCLYKTERFSTWGAAALYTWATIHNSKIQSRVEWL